MDTTHEPRLISPTVVRNTDQDYIVEWLRRSVEIPPKPKPRRKQVTEAMDTDGQPSDRDYTMI